MARLGDTAANGCPTLGVHLLGPVIQLADGATVGDALARESDFVLLIVDGAALGESHTPAAAYDRTADDGATIDDLVRKTLTRRRFDGVTIAEVFSTWLGTLLQLWDGVNVGDTAVKAITARLADSALLEEMFDALLAFGLSILDQVNLSEGVGKAVTMERQDTVMLSESEALALFALIILTLRERGR